MRLDNGSKNSKGMSSTVYNSGNRSKSSKDPKSSPDWISASPYKSSASSTNDLSPKKSDVNGAPTVTDTLDLIFKDCQQNLAIQKEIVNDKNEKNI